MGGLQLSLSSLLQKFVNLFIHFSFVSEHIAPGWAVNNILIEAIQMYL
jgi:hypothetical protein